jgi:hypothetical protein
MEMTMTVAEFHKTQNHLEGPESVSARWFSAAVILGSGFLSLAALSFAFG